MVAQITVRTTGVDHIFRFVKSTRLHRQSRQIRFFLDKRPFYFIPAQHVLVYHRTQEPWEILYRPKPDIGVSETLIKWFNNSSACLQQGWK